MKYLLPDSSVEELHIQKQDIEDEADGEFVFDTLEEAKAEALRRIDRVLKELNRTRKQIEDTK